MRFSTLLAALLLLSSYTVSAQERLWQKEFNGSGDDRPTDAIRTADGGYLVLGWTNSKRSHPDARLSGFLLKLDVDGNKQWERIFGRHFVLTPGAIFPHDNGGYIIIGNGRNEHTGSQISVTIVDGEGNVLKDTLQGKIPLIEFGGALRTSDGGFLVTGSTYLAGYATGDTRLAKLDRDGNLQWEKLYAFGGFDGASGAVETSDGGYMVTGRCRVSDAVGPDANLLLLRTDSKGDTLWARPLVHDYTDDGKGIFRQPDSSVLVVAHSRHISGSGEVVSLYRFSDEGELLARDSFGMRVTEFTLASAEQTPDGGMLLSGSVLNNGYLAKLAPDGTLQWKNEYSADSLQCQGVRAVPVSDREALFLARVNHTLSTYWDTYIMKIVFAVSGIERGIVLPRRIDLR